MKVAESHHGLLQLASDLALLSKLVADFTGPILCLGWSVNRGYICVFLMAWLHSKLIWWVGVAVVDVYVCFSLAWSHSS